MDDPLATNPELVWLFAQAAAAAVLNGDGDPDTPKSELRISATEAGLAAVLPRIRAEIARQIAAAPHPCQETDGAYCACADLQRKQDAAIAEAAHV